MSFAECTATSIRPSSSASCSSFTNTPREPICPNGFVLSRSPAVVMGTSAISTPGRRRRSAASSACVSASLLPLLPILISIETEQVAERLGVLAAVRAGGSLLEPHRGQVQELVHDLGRHRLNCLPVPLGEPGQPGLHPLELPRANVLRARTQRRDRGNDAERRLPLVKAFSLLRDERLRARRLASPPG